MRIVKPEVVLEEPLFGEEMLKKIESAGRTCYKSEDKITEESARKFVRMLIDRGHESVLEHAAITVRWICDRGVTHELVRHRLASYSQESTRYCNYLGDDIQFLCPPFESHFSEASYKHWCEAMVTAEAEYKELIKCGESPQIARSVLPNSLKTEIVITMNVREWRHFFRMRCSQAAHPQMREMAFMTLKMFRDLVPVLFDDVGEED